MHRVHFPTFWTIAQQAFIVTPLIQAQPHSRADQESDRTITAQYRVRRVKHTVK